MARKKTLSLSAEVRRNWIEPDPDYSIRRQCRLAGVPRSSYHYEPVPESKENLELMRLMDEQYLRHPEFGSPRMTDWLQEQGYSVTGIRVPLGRLIENARLVRLAKFHYNPEKSG